MFIFLIDDKCMVTDKKEWKNNYWFIYLFLFAELINLLHGVFEILSHVTIRSSIKLSTQM